MLIFVLLCVFGLCFSIFNLWFQQDRYKRVDKEELQRLNWFNSPPAWLLYTGVFFIALLGILSFYIFRLMTAITELN